MKELDQEVICEFLSHENLSRLDQELVELEKRPNDAAIFAGVFRTLHTIKGTCGFLLLWRSPESEISRAAVEAMTTNKTYFFREQGVVWTVAD